MQLRTIGLGALVGGLLTSALTAVMYAVNQWLGLSFAPFDFFNWITRIMPGPLVTFGIDTMIDTMLFLGIDVADSAKTAERAAAVLQFLAIGVVIGAVYFAVLRSRRARGSWRAGLLAGAVFAAPMVTANLIVSQAALPPIANVLWLSALFLLWGGMLDFCYKQLHAEPEPAPAAVPAEPSVTRIDRRRFLIQLGASTAVITVAGAGVGAMLAQADARRRALAAAGSAGAEAAVGAGALPNAGAAVQPVPGTRPEYTPVEDHYKVFLQTEPTRIDGAEWLLPVTGLVDNPMMLTVDDFRTRWESFDQYVTLSCISGRIGTSLISTTKWTGVSVQDVLADLGLQEGARYLYITSGDGFYETVDIELIMSDPRIMLCYAWDDEDLPQDHGYPLRIWIPDRYGMKQPKWITGIEVTDAYREGYWVERNWDEVAQVKATSVIDTVAVDDIITDGSERRVPIGGIAFSGARGISRVQVRVDGGAWQDAQLRTPLSETTWVIWRYEWPFMDGEHLFEVRCAEGDGTPQIEETTDNRPDGATGIHSREAEL